MGRFVIQNLDGEVLHETDNVVSEFLQRTFLLGMTSRKQLEPRLIGIGSRYGTVSEEPWLMRNLVSEMGRFPVVGAFIDPVTIRAIVVALVRPPNLVVPWREFALFDAGSPLVQYGDRAVTSCDSLNIQDANRVWYSGSGNLISSDPKGAEGFGMIRTVSPITGGNDQIFANARVDLDVNNPQTLTVETPRRVEWLAGRPYSFDKNRTRLQMHLYIQSVESFTGTLDVYLYNLTVGGSAYFKWAISTANLVDGFNYLDLVFKTTAQITPATYTETGSPSFATTQRAFELKVNTRASDVVLGIDEIRLYQDGGVMLARSEIYPPFLKQKEAMSVSWVIDPIPEV